MGEKGENVQAASDLRSWGQGAVDWPRGVGGVCGAASRQLQFAACPFTVQQGDAERNPKMQSFP
jgi:hypothetical protein